MFHSPTDAAPQFLQKLTPFTHEFFMVWQVISWQSIICYGVTLFVFHGHVPVLLDKLGYLKCVQLSRIHAVSSSSI